MSCRGCQQGTGCDGLGGIPAAQVAALEDYTVAGSVVAWGGKILWPGTNESISWHPDAEAKIKNNLWAHGGFSSVDAGDVSSWGWTPYISIKVRTQVDFAHLGNIETTIEGAIYNAGFQPDTQNFWVESVPQSAANRPGVAQPNATAGQPNPNSPNVPGNQRGFCEMFPLLCPSNDPNEKGFLDQVAEWLHITPTEAAVVGAGAALIGVLLIKRAL